MHLNYLKSKKANLKAAMANAKLGPHAFSPQSLQSGIAGPKHHSESAHLSYLECNAVVGDGFRFILV